MKKKLRALTIWFTFLILGFLKNFYMHTIQKVFWSTNVTGLIFFCHKDALTIRIKDNCKASILCLQKICSDEYLVILICEVSLAWDAYYQLDVIAWNWNKPHTFHFPDTTANLCNLFRLNLQSIVKFKVNQIIMSFHIIID